MQVPRPPKPSRPGPAHVHSHLLRALRRLLLDQNVGAWDVPWGRLSTLLRPLHRCSPASMSNVRPAAARLLYFGLLAFEFDVLVLKAHFPAPGSCLTIQTTNLGVTWAMWPQAEDPWFRALSVFTTSVWGGFAFTEVPKILFLFLFLWVHVSPLQPTHLMCWPRSVPKETGLPASLGPRSARLPAH